MVKNNLIESYQGAYYRYDAQGNVIEKTHAGQNLKLDWDNLNRLRASEQNGKSTQYGYDVFGRRLFKQTGNSTHNQGLTVFGWDGDLMIWESSQAPDETQSYTKHYVYEPNSFVPLIQAGYQGFIKLIDTPDYSQPSDRPYSMRTDPVWKTDTRSKRAELQRVAFYHCDQVGTPQALSNEKGELVWDASLNTWGQVLEIKASDNVLEQTNIRFQGQYYDAETGLHYNRYRYYEPHSARYVGKVPIGLDGGVNNSSYVANSNQWIDPMGLMEGFVTDLTNSSTYAGLRQEAGRQQSCYERTSQMCQFELIGTKQAVAAAIRATGADYLACSAGVGDLPGSVGYVFNVHNLDEFSAKNVSLTGMAKPRAMTKAPIIIPKATNILGKIAKGVKNIKPSGSWVLGWIQGMPENLNKGTLTTNFLQGSALSVSGSYWLRGRVVKPISDDPLVQKLYSFEGGVGMPDFDVGYGETE
ncbi:RHS repeat-associated protein [Acinetobacter calcoaceticus]|uniref:RHS repeat-associated protein n=1 Tax=Acinetobacter calcoaceticus TaxID=471 RepID=A0A4R1XJ76_ACICA|nr:RHS repeat-associated protein [Acinetobacter calcoaceticus]